MGSASSSRLDVNTELVDDIVDIYEDQENGAEMLNEKLQEVYDSIKGDADDPDYSILKIVRDEKCKVQEFEKKKNAVKAYKKAEAKGHSVVMVKGGSVHEGKCSGDAKHITFLIGMAFGKGWSDLGPLNDEGSEYCIFDDDDEEGDDDEDDDDEDEEQWIIIKATNDGSGIKSEDFKKKKKAKKKFQNRAGNGRVCVVINDRQVKMFTGDGDNGGDMGDDEMKKRLTFIIGVAYGRDWIDDLGPLDNDDSELGILEDDFDE
jgi:hypothetical protein